MIVIVIHLDAMRILLLCAGNDDIDDDDVENDDVFQIPDAVFGSAGCQTAGVTVNGEILVFITFTKQVMFTKEVMFLPALVC